MTPPGEYTVLDWGEKETTDRYVCGRYNGKDAGKLNRISCSMRSAVNKTWGNGLCLGG